MKAEKYLEQKATTIYSGGMNEVKVINLEYASAAVDLARKEMIDKACEYLRNHIDKDLTIYHNETWVSLDEFIKRFRKELEEWV